jgi:pyridoxal phosphate enzyme (YggS family)
VVRGQPLVNQSDRGGTGVPPVSVCIAQSLSRPAHAFPSCTLVSLVVTALMSIAENISLLRSRIIAAAHRVHRNPENIALMAVTKTVASQHIREAYAEGLRIFGENRVQEFATKAEALKDLPGAEWHMIGHLQTNKAGKAVELFSHIDSIDSLRLAQKLNSAASNLGTKLLILIEINIAGEAAKSGLLLDSSELQELLKAAPELPFLQIRGLMAVPPYNDNPEQSRPYFRRMRAQFEQIASRNFAAVRMQVLSMGMSHDFEIAIEEGSTCVRLGTAIFGDRPPLRSKL